MALLDFSNNVLASMTTDILIQRYNAALKFQATARGAELLQERL